MTDLDREEIARLIVEGCTSGRLDVEVEDDKGGFRYVSWELKTNEWSD